MTRSCNRLPILAIFGPLMIVAAMVARPASGAAPAGLPLWSQGDPDPTYPFSDRYPIAVIAATREEAQSIALTGIDVESILPDGATWTVRANVSPAEEQKLRDEGREVYRLRNLPLEAARAVPPGSDDPKAWPTFAELVADLQGVANAHPDICRLVSIGQSVQGRGIWFMKITDNPDAEEDEPEFKYTSTIHGDEVTGLEMCRRLIHHLVDNYGTDPTITTYVNEMETWICPLHNPDGYVAVTRYNANGVDLNRNFPDPVTDPNDNPAGRQLETQAMMYFGYDHRFVLSANYHGGALVVNYPWDCQTTYTPDDAMIRNFSLGYSFRNPPMWNSSVFENGVTIGWAWYVIHGGLQDWCYHWRSDIDVTIEVSTTKWPNYTEMDTYWNNNRDAMLYYMGRAMIGIRGIVTSATTGLPVDATVNVVQIGKTIRTDPDVGDFHRLLEPGTYTLDVSAFGYVSQTIPGIVVIDGPATRRDVVLEPLPSYVVSGTVTQAGTGIPLDATIQAINPANQSVIAQTQTNPVTGHYSFLLQTAIYDLRASASEHLPQTRTIEVSGDRTESFVLESMADGILVVQDGATTRIANDLVALGYAVQVETAAATDTATWSSYKLLVWSSGANPDPVNDATDRQALERHIARGRSLLIEGGQIGYDTFRNPGYPSFGANVLRCSAWDVSNAGSLTLAQPAHPLATTPNALASSYAIQYTGASDQDAVRPLPDAVAVYTTVSYPNDAGVLAYDNTPDQPATGQIVFYPFYYNRLTDQAGARALLENTVTYLDRSSLASIDWTVGPPALRLGSPHPNPASDEILFDLHNSSPAALASVGIYDLQGRCMRSWLARTEPGHQVLRWNGLMTDGRRVPSGVYYVRVESPLVSASRPFVWLRQ